MTRMTKEEAAYKEEQRAAYPRRFLEVLASAVKENFELTEVMPDSAVYVFRDRDNEEVYAVCSNYDGDDGELEALEFEVEFKFQKRMEVAQLLETRRTA